ncbi:MAG: NAD(+) kinase [Pseudomonadota bacterium]
MSVQFETVAVVARRQRKNVADTVLAVEAVLRDLGCAIVFEDDTAGFLPDQHVSGAARRTCPREDLGSVSDLIVVVGGDGSLLGVSRALVGTPVPVLGVNRGGLGFLAGVSPDLLDQQLREILCGEYVAQNHFLLAAAVLRDGQVFAQSVALNDVVVHSGSMAKMLEFSMSVNDEFVYDQRSDGLIVASPTGSTAYALSAGGPIMHPDLDAFVVVPMFPHTLTSRPLVVPGEVQVKLRIMSADGQPKISCDSQVNMTLHTGDEVLISKLAEPLRLIYPLGHSFYESCRSKLDWATRLGGQQD